MAKKTVAKKPAAKKAPTKKIAKKETLVKKTKMKSKGEFKPGRKWHMPSAPILAKGSLLEFVTKAFLDADGSTLGENEIIVAATKAGFKDQGTKTVKKLVKGVLRNMSRAGVIIKDRERKKLEKEAKANAPKEKKPKASDIEVEDDDDAEDVVEDDDAEGDEADEEEETKPAPKKKVVSKKK